MYPGCRWCCCRSCGDVAAFGTSLTDISPLEVVYRSDLLLRHGGVSSIGCRGIDANTLGSSVARSTPLEVVWERWWLVALSHPWKLAMVGVVGR